jgi:hypothetical protein
MQVSNVQSMPSSQKASTGMFRQPVGVHESVVQGTPSSQSALVRHGGLPDEELLDEELLDDEDDELLEEEAPPVEAPSSALLAPHADTIAPARSRIAAIATGAPWTRSICAMITRSGRSPTAPEGGARL